MLDYVTDQPEIVAPFVAQLIPEVGARGFGKCSAIGFVDRGTLVGGVVYHTWDPPAGVIQISSAVLPGAHCFTRETLKRMYQYPFHQLDCQMIFANVAAEDERMLWIFSRQGFEFTIFPRLRGRDKDAVICRLTREAWAENKVCRRYKHHIQQPPLSEAA